MNEQTMQDDPGRQRLSALMDGEAGPAEVDQACATWRDDARARDDWHAYHLIGDLLRSDDLSTSPQRDAQFLERLRGQLATLPIVLAPQPQPQPAIVARRSAWQRAWAAPLAVAAGFVAVAGVLVVTRVVAPDGAAQDMATSMAQAEPGRAVASVGPVALQASGASVSKPVSDVTLIRDARLDRYLAAHKQFGSSSALAVPGGVLRSASVIAPER